MSRVLVAYRGVEGLRVSDDGSLVVNTAFGELTESTPRVYQEIDGQRLGVDGRFKLAGKESYGFEVGPYQHQYPLVIDPKLSYSTYLGGANSDGGSSIVVDAFGFAYVTGGTRSTPGFPTIPASQNMGLNSDVFVTKLDPAGQLVYSTVFGGFGDERGSSVALDKSGDAYVTGNTNSIDFPVSGNAFQHSKAGPDGYDAFVAKLNPSGALVYSTYLGGAVACPSSNDPNEVGLGIAADAAGNAFVTGQTDTCDFPVTPGAFQTATAWNRDAFVTKLNPDGSALLYSTFLGGDAQDLGQGIAVDSYGNTYVVGAGGQTFPTTPGAFRRTPLGWEAFVTKLNANGSGLVYSTFLGGSDHDHGMGIALDSAQNAYVTGFTYSENFSTTPGAFQPSYGGASPFCPGDAFVTKLGADGSALVYSTYLGGDNIDRGYGIALDPLGNAYVTGSTISPNFPTVDALQTMSEGGGCDVGGDAFVAKVNVTGSALVYSSYLGGSSWQESGYGMAVDTAGNAYVTGYTESTNFPTANPLQASNQGNADVFIAKIGTAPLGATPTITPNYGGDTGSVTALVHGTGFDPGTKVKLTRSGQPDITGSSTVVEDQGRLLTTVFDLTARARGKWNLVVTNPDGASVTVPDSFTIEAGRAPQVWVDIVGRGVVMAGRKYQYNIVAGNRGNVDVQGVFVEVRMPRDVAVQLLPVPEGTGTSAPVIGVSGEERFLSLFFPQLSPRATLAVPVALTFPTIGGTSSLHWWWVTHMIPPDVPPSVDPSVVRYAELVGSTSNSFQATVQVADAAGSDSLSVQFTANETTEDREPTVDIIETNGNVKITYRATVIGSKADVQVDIMRSIEQGERTRQRLERDRELQNANQLRVTQAEITKWLTEKGCILPGEEPGNQGALSRYNNGTFFLEAVSDPVGELPGVGGAVAGGYWTAATRVMNSAWKAELAKVAKKLMATTIEISPEDEFKAGEKWRNGECSDPFPETDPSDDEIAQAVLKKYAREKSQGQSQSGAGTSSVNARISHDPNAKSGSEGHGVQRYISGAEPLRYTVFFENVNTATAAAQEVVVTDHLDPARIALGTLSLGLIAFGNIQVSPPPDSKSFSRDIDLRPAKQLIVRVEAALDANTGGVTWHFTSIDPATGLLPEDPLLGFLPPNVNPPEGEGNVVFTVMAKPGLATNTEVQNTATIVFDVNPPLETPSWFNTLDNNVPTSQVQPLAAFQTSPNFPVQWAGADVGSGIQDYTIFVSENGAPMKPWLTNTSATSSPFQGKQGVSYAFYSVARDLTNNVENAPTDPDMSTTVGVPTPTPTLVPSVGIWGLLVMSIALLALVLINLRHASVKVP